MNRMINIMAQEEIAAVCKGCKAGTDSVAAKSIITDQVASLNDVDIEAIAAEIKK